jgi:hypothetical protein
MNTNERVIKPEEHEGHKLIYVGAIHESPEKLSADYKDYCRLKNWDQVMIKLNI